MNQTDTVAAFNPALILVAVVLVAACAITYRRTRSWGRTALAALAVVATYVVVGLVLHMAGFE